MPPWLWLIILFLAVSGLALLGIKGDATWLGLVTSSTFADDFYGIIQLFVLEGGLLDSYGDAVPWTLRSAAFAAPIVTIFAFLQLVWTDVSNGVSIGLYRFIYHHHVVVFGMGTRGRSFVLDTLAQGKRVVAVDLDPNAAGQIPARYRKFRFINADVFNPHLIARTGLSRAGAVVIFCGSGYTNLSVAQHVSANLGGQGTQPASWPRIICDATGSAHRDQIEADQLIDSTGRPQIEFYSPEDEAARLLITAHRPADYAALFRRPVIHPLVFGKGPLAKAIVRQTAVLTQNAARDIPYITIVAAFDKAELAAFEALAQALSPVCLVQTIDVDLRDPGFWTERFPSLAASASQHVVCLETADQNLELALRLHRETHALADANVPIFAGPLGVERTTPSGEKRPTRLFANNLLAGFGDVPNVLGWQHVVDQQQDKLARLNHENYLAQTRAEPGNVRMGSKPAALPWVNLPERFRFSNRSFVDHLSSKMALVDSVICTGKSTDTLQADAVQTLAKGEHNRWWAERLATGWRWAERRDDRQRFHPDLVEWEHLSDETRAYDVALVENIPALLAKVGKGVRPVCRIGVSGHRDPEISRKNRPLVEAIERQFSAIRQDHPDQKFQIWSPLAEGADRLVAELAMAKLDAELHVPLPLPIDQYCEDFGGQPSGSVDKFQRLLDRAERVYELPLMPREDTPSVHRQWQYASAGAFILQHCHELILVWDGRPANGFGGTGQIAEWQAGGQIPGRLRWQATGENYLARVRKVAFRRDGSA